jgi:hypothetical protein
MAGTKDAAAALTARLEGFPATEKDSAEYLAVQDERDRSAAICKYIMNHPLDRPGTYEYLQREIPA